MLDSEEAARRLGVKVTTLYAYVSRGLVTSYPSATGRRRVFDGDEVEQVARRSRQGRTGGTRLATVTTGITQLTDRGPVYRGLLATDLATRWRFEEVAAWLWREGGDLPPAGPDAVPSPTRVEPPWTGAELGHPPAVGTSDRMRWAVLMAGALDPLRSDLRPEAVTRAARRVVASMVALVAAPPAGPAPAAPPAGPAPPAPPAGPDLAGSLAERVASALAPRPTADVVGAVNAAMVLLADHELATSTMAVRIAASTRADIYDALLSGLGTIAGPLHGGASQLAASLLTDAERDGPERALDETLRWQGRLPGFGHPVYRNGDARCTVLLELVERMATPAQAALVRSLIDLAADHAIPPPNVDLALAALAWCAGMPADTGRTLFTLARVAGWVAHYLEELGERPLRYRARAVYASPGRPTLGA